MNRYLRQQQLPGFGEAGQQKLTEAKVLVVGLGGLGIPVVQYLNAMGVGTLGLVENDTVALHNLQRQVLYTEGDIGQPKLAAVLKQLKAQNSETHHVGYNTFLNSENVLEIISKYDVVVDATDNFATRYLINDACVILNKPFVYGALQGFEGQVSVFNHKSGPTYRCLFPNIPKGMEIPNCNENGVLGVVPGIIGTLQALEVVKVITGIGEPLSGKVLVFDSQNHRYFQMAIQPKPEHQTIQKLLESYGATDCVQVPNIKADAFLKVIAQEVHPAIIDVRSRPEYQMDHLSQALNIPLDDLALPKSLQEQKKPIYILCQSGKRSEVAVAKLQESHPNLIFYSVLGGMNALNPKEIREA
ncbi:MAG: HesA/MoeB/ThiF family protein [Bacteroidota bacterium]